jgi:hypothetical protein
MNVGQHGTPFCAKAATSKSSMANGMGSAGDTLMQVRAAITLQQDFQGYSGRCSVVQYLYSAGFRSRCWPECLILHALLVTLCHFWRDGSTNQKPLTCYRFSTLAVKQGCNQLARFVFQATRAAFGFSRASPRRSLVIPRHGYSNQGECGSSGIAISLRGPP